VADRGGRRKENTVDWGQLRALLIAGIKLDIRTSRAGMGRGKLPPFFVALITYLVMGTLMAAGLISGADAFVYALFTISAAMFMTALTVIMEYVTIVVHPDDHQILSHRPVSSRTYFWAKMGNLLFYVTPIALALTLPAAILGSLTLGAAFRFGVAHLAAGLVACVATAAAVVLLYTGALKVISYERFTSAMTYVHTGATLVLVLAYFLLPRMISEDPALLSLSRGAWVYFAPPAWFAGAVEVLTGQVGRQGVLLTLIAAAGSVAVVAAAMNTISMDYSKRISDLASSSVTAEEEGPGRRARRRPFYRLGLSTLGTGEERAGYALMDAYMRRDRKLRSRVYPAFGLPLAVYVCALIRGDFHSPLVGAAGGEPIALQEIMGLYCVFVSLFFASAMTQSEQWKAGWVFHAAPTADPARVLQGARRLVVWRYLVPFFIMLFLMLSVPMGPLGAFVFVAFVFPMCLAAFAVLSLASPHLPFSQEIERTRQSRQIAFFMILSVGMVPLLILIEFTMASAPLTALPIVAVLWAAAWLAERTVRIRLRHRLAGEEFAG
jgi:ABC-2 type transport system permease protein